MTDVPCNYDQGVEQPNTLPVIPTVYMILEKLIGDMIL